MVQLPTVKDFKVSLKSPKELTTGHMIIRVTYGGGDTLDISLRRTVRVPDNGSLDLPPHCDPFPIYSVKEYKSQLPKEHDIERRPIHFSLRKVFTAP